MLTQHTQTAQKVSYSALRLAWQRHREDMEASGRQADIRLGIAASFTANNLVPFMGTTLLDAGFIPGILVAPFNQILQACFDPSEYFGADSNCAILLWRIEDLMFDELASFIDGNPDSLNMVLEKLDQLADAVAHLRGAFSGTIIVGLPPFPSHASSGLFQLNQRTSPTTFHLSVSIRLRQRLDAIAGVHVLDMDALQADFGVAASLDWRQWYLYRQPFSEAFLLQIAQKLSRMIVASRRAAKKCIILDADNTLWGGIVGEDGLDGIEIGDEFPGSAYRDFQRQLLHWRSQGVFLAVASKNNESDVWEVFDNHEGMLLKREDISVWAVSWQPKADAIPVIAKALNIGTDSLVFIDDNPMEIAYMREARPEVTSIQLPEEPANIVRFMQSLPFFDTLGITTEDRGRADMMRAEKARETLESHGLTKEDFQRALELRIALSLAEQDDLGRVTQLINKTNQFNLTTIRRTLDEVRELSLSKRHLIYTLRVADKFGDYGLTGVVIVEKGGNAAWTIDTLLLSCRVLGRGVETALLAALADDARAEGSILIRARFQATAKNAPASTYLADHGFQPSAEGDWLLKVKDIPAVDPSITRTSSMP